MTGGQIIMGIIVYFLMLIVYFGQTFGEAIEAILFLLFVVAPIIGLIVFLIIIFRS